jgi:restriction system protein
MVRWSGLLHAAVRAQQQAERQRLAQIRAQARAQTQAARAAEKAQKAYLSAQKADQKERTRLYMESQVAQVALKNEQLERDGARLENLLTEALANDEFINLENLKQAPPIIPKFDPGSLIVAELPPILQRYLPPELSAIQKLIPGAKEKRAHETAKGHERYQMDVKAHAVREADRLKRLEEANAKYELQITEIRQKVAAQHAEVDSFKQDFTAGSPPTIVEYFTMVLASSSYPENFPQHAKNCLCARVKATRC